jgi:hypothetical protein
MKVINSNTEIKIYETKLCHACKSCLIYTIYPDKPHKNKGYIICECGHKQHVYDPTPFRFDRIR